ncbi:hypothetical protein V500_10105 [Pseudogymnoascus sp. VKM F-4518 (FW-2643)]|nr:hypothetical protein V500_10105 [Pseudogymnoascus sp. VKM F-4518 (FW-2643)]
MAGTRPPASVRAEDVQRTHLLHLSASPRTNHEATSTLQGSKQWVPFVAGGAGGVTAALLTAPLDVLRTRLQSEFYRRPASITYCCQQRVPSAQHATSTRLCGY